MQPIGIKYHNQIYDTQTLEEQGIGLDKGEPIAFDNSPDALEIIRHSCAHLMAQAIKELYGDVQFFVGPVVQEGFYYDFRVQQKIGEEDLPKIEKKMKDIAKKGAKIQKISLPRADVVARFGGDDLKQAVLSRLHDEQLSIYQQGDFEDLCRGPHLPDVSLLRAFKLTKIAGAYIGGDENTEMLTRIYGIAFADKESLAQYLHQLEEAKKRDHRKVGAEMGLFAFDESIGAGLPLWLPAGARLRRKLEALMTDAHIRREYEPVRGPEILRSDLWKTSGHYQNYGENMYFTHIDELEYGIKPMNCVGHIKVYAHDIRSYRDLPLRFYEYGVVHRHEKSGVLHGLLRVREFTQDDAHIFCMPEQIQDEVVQIVGFAKDIMSAFGFEYEFELSTRPEKSIGDDAVWEKATKALHNALMQMDLPYGVDEGGGAFYGPKIDIKITDAIGRKWQCGTIQVDMNLPERFALEYVAEDNTHKRPVMLHRAILGSFERFIAILTEHYGGEFPLFIAPTQAVIIPITESQHDYARQIHKELTAVGAYATMNLKAETLNKKIRTAEKERVPLILVLGEKEAQNNSIAVRDRRTKEQYDADKDVFIQSIKEKMNEVCF